MNAKIPANEALRIILEKYAQLAMFEDYDIQSPESLGPAGDTPFHMVAYDGDVDAAKIMLPYISNINLGGDIGNSPLHYAVMNKKIDMIRFLVMNGADLVQRNDYGDTPLKEMEEDVFFRDILNETGMGR